MIRLNLTKSNAYLDYLSFNPSEVDKFLSGFTINTSYFFRNREVFDQLQSYITQILKSKEKVSRNEKNDIKPNNENAINTSKLTKLSNPKLQNGLTKKILKPNSYARPRRGKDLDLTQFSIYKKIKSKSPSTLYIWSCACASGQEPYSLAMQFEGLQESVRNFPEYKIVASDIDQVALSKAKEGLYVEEIMKEVPNYIRLRYFTKIPDQFGMKYKICDEIKEKVEFLQEDVTRSHQKSYKYDIIFCRYFLIYTDRAARNKILSRLIEQLADGGLLILGKTETLFKVHNWVRLINSKNHIYLKVRSNNVKVRGSRVR